MSEMTTTDRLAQIQAAIPDAAVEAAAQAIIDAAYGQELPEAPEDLARAALDAAVPALLAMVRERDAALERVRELHHGNRWGFCEACSEHIDIPMPCPTRAAITATEGA